MLFNTFRFFLPEIIFWIVLLNNLLNKRTIDNEISKHPIDSHPSDSVIAGLDCMYRVVGFTSSLGLPKSQRECITRQRTRSSNILSCWMLEYGDYNTLPIRTPRSFDLVSDFISRISLIHLISIFYYDSLYGCAWMCKNAIFIKL